MREQGLPIDFGRWMLFATPLSLLYPADRLVAAHARCCFPCALTTIPGGRELILRGISQARAASRAASGSCWSCSCARPACGCRASRSVESDLARRSPCPVDQIARRFADRDDRRDRPVPDSGRSGAARLRPRLEDGGQAAVGRAAVVWRRTEPGGGADRQRSGPLDRPAGQRARARCRRSGRSC